MSVVVIVSLQACQGCAQEALTLLKRSQEHCLHSEGCEGFEVLHDQHDEHRFMFVERWSSAEHHKRVLASMMDRPTYKDSMRVFASGPCVEYWSTA
jgi:quinol monooxygenase YgiN